MPDATAANISLLLLRVVLGVVFLAHGINHVFRGGKIAGTGRWFESLGMKPGVLHAWLASLTEIGAGALLLVGFLTPLAGAGVVGTMLVAWITNHLKNGFFIFRPGEGYEYVMTLTFLGLGIAGLGAGEWSLDHAAGIFEEPSMSGFLIGLIAGGGTMGAGIAQVLLEAGCEVVVVEADVGAAMLARGRIIDGLCRRKDVTSEEVATRSGRLSTITDLSESLGVELVVEAIPEIPDAKRDLLAAAEKVVPPTALLASNTSSLSITDLAGALERPERFLGMHFFNPVPLSALVELVVGDATTPAAVDDARQWVARLGKESIEVRDSPGFATSRLGVALGLEAIRMLEEGVASAADIDQGMVLGYRHPMGPLRLTDLVGLDVRLAIAEHLAATLGPRFEPPALLRDKVAAGELGKKTGRGFYEWT